MDLEGLDRRERTLGDNPGRVDLAVTHVVVLLYSVNGAGGEAQQRW